MNTAPEPAPVNRHQPFAAPWASCAALGALVFLAAVLRLAPLSQERLWLDELHTSWVVTDGLAEVAPRAQLGNHGPLYFYAPWLTTHWLGPSEFSLRIPSLLAGLALVPMAFVVTVQCSGSRLAGLAAALLVALDDNCVFFAQEARPYACVQLLALMNLACFWQVLTKPALAARVAWVFSGTLLFHVHYTAALWLMAQGLFFIGLVLSPWLRGRFLMLKLPGDGSLEKSRATAPLAIEKLARFGFDATLLAIFCLPAGPHFFELAQRKNDWWAFIQPPSWHETWELLPVWPNVGLPLLALAVLTLVRYARGQTSALITANWRAHALLLCVGLIPLAVVALATHFQLAPLFHRRYVVGSLAAILMLGVSLATCFRARWARSLWLLCMVAANVGENELVGQGLATGQWTVSRNQNWRGAIEFINHSAHEHWPVLVHADLLETNAFLQSDNRLKHEYCLLPVRGLYRLAPEFTTVVPVSSDLGVEWLSRQNPSGAFILAVSPPEIRERLKLSLDSSTHESWKVELHEFGEVMVMRVTRGEKHNEISP